MDRAPSSRISSNSYASEQGERLSAIGSSAGTNELSHEDILKHFLVQRPVSHDLL